MVGIFVNLLRHFVGDGEKLATGHLQTRRRTQIQVRVDVEWLHLLTGLKSARVQFALKKDGNTEDSFMLIFVRTTLLVKDSYQVEGAVVRLQSAKHRVYTLLAYF